MAAVALPFGASGVRPFEDRIGVANDINELAEGEVTEADTLRPKVTREIAVGVDGVMITVAGTSAAEPGCLLSNGLCSSEVGVMGVGLFSS